MSQDLSSYSLGQIVLNNVGNLFYWFYVVSLPFGPIWLMHAFFTLTSILMLTWYFLYRKAPATANTSPQRRASFQENFGKVAAIAAHLVQ